MTTFRIIDPIFKTEPIFILGCSASEAQAFLLKRYRCRVPMNDGPCGTMITHDRYPRRIVWVKHYPNSPTNLGYFLHEVFHLVVRICADRGVPIVDHIESGECGDETAAHLFEFFARECLLRIRKRRTASARN